MKTSVCIALLAALPLLASELEEAWEPQGASVIAFNRHLQEALANKDWWDAIDYADLIGNNFPASPFAQELPYLSGYAYFQLGQYELANETLSSYLNRSSNHSHFEEAIQMKFEIAESYLHGRKKRLFGSHKMPAWLPAQEDALEIYDEVIATLPHSEMAAKSLLGKAKIQAEFEEFKPAVETLALLIRKFPKQEAAAEAYLQIGQVYLQQSKMASLDLDILDLAKVNLSKFRLAFPREPRVAEAEQVLSQMEELFAQNLLETGQFFERTKKPSASIIYYNKVVATYPTTKAAEVAKSKLHKL